MPSKSLHILMFPAAVAVVGVAVSTRSVYYGKGTPRLQMVFKQCIPVAALTRLIRRP